MAGRDRPLVILTGPTASGKTGLSVQLAKEIGEEIISADSMQIYRKMRIGTARVTPEEMEGIPHYLVDELDPAEAFNVVRFREMALAAVEKILDRGRIPIVAGGTGFYIQALLYDVDFSEHDGEAPYRQELRQIAEKEGKEALHRMLTLVDPDYAATVHSNNVKRVIRALEYYHETGQTLSSHNLAMRSREPAFLSAYFVLEPERQVLYDRINRRVDLMMEEGLLDEVRGLVEEGYDRDLVSMQGIGYQEFFDYFDGKQTLEETVSLIKRNTRRFAKRQMTWFRREKDVIRIPVGPGTDREDVILEMKRILGRKGIISGTE